MLGIGNELRGDDAAGLWVARGLNARPCSSESVYVIEAGASPENVTGELRSFGPQAVLLVDAAQMGLPPGAVRLLAMDDIEGLSASTHSLPLSMLAAYLVSELNCRVALFGIQPASDAFGWPVSTVVERAVDEMIREICACLPVPARR